MTRKSTNSSRRSPRSGLTLIEVTAGILLLSTLLVASIVAFQQHARQIKRANRTVAAIDAADELLSQWFAAGVRVPPQGEGQVRGDESLRWRTSVVGAGQDDTQPWQIVRLQIRDTESFRDARAIVDVEVVVPRAMSSTANP